MSLGLQRVHIDRALTNISIGYTNEAYIADQIFKPIQVQKQSDKYYTYGMEMFRQHDDLRAPGTEASEITWTLSADQYYTEGHALRTMITDEEQMNADEAFILEVDATQLITEGVLLNKEASAAGSLLNPANYHAALVKTLGAGGTFKWSDYANSDPRLDIAKAKQDIHGKSGVRPNTLIISETVLNVLLMHPKLSGMIQYVMTPVLNMEQLKILLGVPNILVGSAMKSTVTNPGQSAAGTAEPLNYIWGNSAVLCYIAPTPARKQISIGYSFMWNKDNAGAVQVRKWYDISRKSTFIEAERWYSHKMVSNLAGFLFADAVAPLA